MSSGTRKRCSVAKAHLKKGSPMVRAAWLVQASVLVLALLFLGGCGSSAPANFYLLQARATPATQILPKPGPARMSIGIGPVEIPEYLDRPQMVIRTGVNTVRVDEFERWAEPLKDGVARVVTDNLADLLERRRIAVYPWRNQLKTDYRLVLTLSRFEASADGQAILAGWWTLYDTENRVVSMRKPVLLVETTSGRRTDALVEGQSRLLAELCEEIAAAIGDLPAITEKLMD
jgi:uncharacterized lipoprotein YmbA